MERELLLLELLLLSLKLPLEVDLPLEFLILSVEQLELGREDRRGVSSTSAAAGDGR